jgi:hypothetical protein
VDLDVARRRRGASRRPAFRDVRPNEDRVTVGIDGEGFAVDFVGAVVHERSRVEKRLRPTRKEFALLAASWLVWSVVAVHIRGPSASLPGFSDHFSHFGHAQLFLRHGFDIYRNPESAFCSPNLSPDNQAFYRDSECLPSYTCQLPGARALCINWQQYPIPYPPGLLLYSLPQALLYGHTRVPFRSINAATMVEYLAAAHLLFWVLLRGVFEPGAAERLARARGEPSTTWLRYGLFAVVYLEVLTWTFEGFYDSLPIACVLLGLHLLSLRRPADALVALAASFFLHYRALWYAPIFVLAAVRAARTRTTATRWKAGLALVLVAPAAYGLCLLYPTLPSWPETSHVLWKDGWFGRPATWSLLVPAAIVAAQLVRSRSFMLLSAMACQLWIVMHAPQLLPWHAMFLLPMLGVARLEKSESAIPCAALLCIAEAEVVFGAFPLPGDAIVLLASMWGR